ncbi:MAG TPA: YdcH family protein [Thermoanaerobaculia bacterium]|nr:YdcH family protein [Thermoanaerobaculia bacterium]
MAQTDALKEELLATDAEFRRLHEDHQELERRLESLRGQTLLSQEDEVEIKRIKREKLRLKDAMEAILRARQAQAPVNV